MKFSDPIDQGSHLAELHNQNLIDIQRRQAAPQQERNPDGTWPTTECGCGEPIEPVRLEHGRILCFACQDAKEKQEKSYGRK